MPERKFVSTWSRSNSQTPDHESDTLTTEPPVQGAKIKNKQKYYRQIQALNIKRLISSKNSWSKKGY